MAKRKANEHSEKATAAQAPLTAEPAVSRPSSYTVLARRYRSTCFGEVVGQQTVAQTLIGAIAGGRVAHAYLFTGTRGVGKTSMARLFARALNAPDTVRDCPKPAGKPDYPPLDVQQRMADAIMRGEDLNVIEIDAASSRSVEEARQLIANAGLAPTGNARFKVYIIDEVHMLTREAFNTLLKTMEEPPEHVKFILCTTEPHRVPATIQSRCQRFDFRNIPAATIAKHLRDVVEREKLAADEDLLWQVARLANGSMRDALSLLDRLIARGEQPLTSRLLGDLLGLAPQELMVRLVDDLASGDVGAALQRAGEILDTGVGQEQLLASLIDRLRQLLLLRACGSDSDLVELGPEAKAEAQSQAEKFDASGLAYMIALCENTARNCRLSQAPRALLDATIVRLALAEKMADVTALLTASAPVDHTPSTAKKKLSEAPPTPPRPVPVAGYVRQTRPPQVPAAAPAANRPAPANAAEVWARVLEAAGGGRSTGWLASLELVKVGDTVVQVAPRPGQREILNFARHQRTTEQLGQWFAAALGRRVRVEVVPRDDDGSGGASAANPDGADAIVAMTQQRQQALALPLVQQVLEHFDATLLGVRPETVAPAPTAADPAGVEAEPLAPTEVADV